MYLEVCSLEGLRRFSKNGDIDFEVAILPGDYGRGWASSAELLVAQLVNSSIWCCIHLQSTTQGSSWYR